MDRREFLVTKRKDPQSRDSDKESVRTFSGLNPYNGPWTANEVIHLLKRTMFGSTPEDIAHFSGLSMDQAVDQLLTTSSIPPSPPLKNYNTSAIDPADPDYYIPMGSTWVTTNTTSQDGARRISFKAWWMGLLIKQERNISEKMTLFWHNHFSTETNEVDRGIWAYQNNQLCRQYALGNFKQMVKAVTLDVAMLRYLNGHLNTAGAPDENYARELQ
ncbi:MAG TPA: DUF1800 family protein, partial [Chitinophagaceae bacterium]|nr:DUF1800 family protein [Chitinophagaceae bacterium]